MADSDPKPRSPLSQRRDPSSAEQVRLLTELAAPYRSLRRFIYLAAGFSATIGAFVFFFQALAGRDLSTTLPSLALQLGILAGAIGLNRLENRSHQKVIRQVKQRLGMQQDSQEPQRSADS